MFVGGRTYMHETLLDYLYESSSLDRVVAFRHRPRLREHRWTYGELSATAFRFARELETRGIGRGDRVLIWAENCPEWVAAFYGILLRGAIAVPLDEHGSPDFAARVCRQTEPKLVLYGRGIDVSPLDIPSIPLEALVETIASHSADPMRADSIQPSDIVEIVFTSGTTAEPKGVELTHENILTNIAPIEREIAKYIRWEFIVRPLKIVSLMPLSHVFGQMLGIFIPRLLRAEVVLQNRLSPSDIIHTIRTERAAVLGAPPRVLETLRNKLERDLDISRELNAFLADLTVERSWPARWWHFRRVHRVFGFKFLSMVTGGARLDTATEDFWRRLGFAVVQGYGMTETAALISLNNPFSARAGSLGEVLSGRENVRIGVGGEILVRGKSVSPGLWGSDNRPGDEWLATGDIGSMDETGRLFFKGRKKDVIVTAAGLNIYPGDLEAALDAQPETIACTVVGVEGENGPEPAAALILRKGSDPAEVVSRANNSLADFQRIRRWVVWPDADLPRTSTHKVRKNEVADYISRQSGSHAKKAHASPLAALIAGIKGGGKTAGPESRLSEDLGMDSLARVELISAIEDRYQVDLDESAFTASATVGDLEKAVRGDAVEAKPLKFAYPKWPLRFPVTVVRSVFNFLVLQPVTRILGRATVAGTENLRDLNGPVLFVSNHVAEVDPGLIMAALPRRIRRRLAIAMDGERLMGYRQRPAGTGLFTRMRYFVQYFLVIGVFNAFPLPRRSGFRRSFQFAGEAMDRGFSVLIFPEGELTPDGNIRPFRAGIGILASGLEAPVVPVKITGLWELKSSGQRGYAPAGAIKITIGSPLDLDPNAEPAAITRVVESAVRTL